jgi:acetylornithine/succinyldiaminopimelate/putrescine aminotransferase
MPKTTSDNQSTFYNHLAQTTGHPIGLEVDRADGIYIFDKDGKAYMDMISGISVNNIGHSHPQVIGAIQEQLKKHMHVMAYGEFIQDAQSKLAEKLTEILPPDLNCFYFVNSGTEANEGAIKLAKRYTGRSEIISCYNSYHGNTSGSLSLTGNEQKKYAFRPLIPGVRFIQFNKVSDLNEITDRTAAVIIEPIQGDAGVRIPSKRYMQALRHRCDETGALLILDEVQTGFGRTGKWFAFEHFDIQPDILTLAKAMGGGMPIGAFIARKEVMDTLAHHPKLGHITTFGGHPVNCAAARATIEVLQKDNIISEVEEKGRLLESLLIHDAICEIRRIGLMMAVEFDNAGIVEDIVKECLKEGVITFWFLSTSNSFRLAPPLIISRDQIRYAAEKINRAIDKVTIKN